MHWLAVTGVPHAYCWHCAAGLFDNTLSDYLWSRAVLLVGPTIATVGLQLQVPMVMAADPLLHAEGWWSRWDASVLEVGGAAAILFGFFTLNFSSDT